MEKIDKKTITERICNAVAKQLRKPVAEVTPAKKLKEELNADSLDVVELMMNLEEEYNLTIEDDELTKMQTINDVADYIYRVLNR